MTQTDKLQKLIERAIDRGFEFDNLDKWEWKAIKKTDTVINNWYYFHITYEDKEKFIDAEHIIFDRNFAHDLFGEFKDIEYKLHYIPARGYPGESIPKDKIADSSKDENWYCIHCKKKWVKCFEIPCNQIAKYNQGWQNVLQEAVISEDPIDYMYRAVFQGKPVYPEDDLHV